MRHSYDFDAQTCYKMLYLKLSRVYDCMLNDSHLMWNSSPSNVGMRKLNECRILAKKLAEDDYSLNYNKLMLKYRDDRRNSIFSDMRIELYPNAKVIPTKMYSTFLKKAFAKDNNNRLDDKKRFYQLLDKHLDSWWD